MLGVLHAFSQCVAESGSPHGDIFNAEWQTAAQFLTRTGAVKYHNFCAKLFYRLEKYTSRGITIIGVSDRTVALIDSGLFTDRKYGHFRKWDPYGAAIN